MGADGVRVNGGNADVTCASSSGQREGEPAMTQSSLVRGADGGLGAARCRRTVRRGGRGWLWRVHWYGIYPLHARVFQGMLEGIANRVTACDRS